MTPVGNRDIRAAREYHDRTAHSYQSVRQSGHVLDWDTKPFLYKVYPDLPVTLLPREFPQPPQDTLEAMATFEGKGATLTLETLASLLFFTAGLTKKKTHPGGGEMHFRAAPSTGALYQTEVYVVAGELPALSAGVYHFSPGDFCLRRLRAGDFRGELGVAAVDERIPTAAATLVLTAIYWRNTWKYQARAYRHLFWDSGTMLANLLATAAGLGIPARLVTFFVDERINRLLALDAEKEVSLELVPLGTSAAPPPAADVSTEPITPRTIPLSSSEVEYPLVRYMHAVSSLVESDELRTVRPSHPGEPRSIPEHLVSLPGPLARAGRSLGETILGRGSTRQFSGQPISAEALSTVLFHATRGIPADFLPAPGRRLVDLYLIVNAVETIPSGAYCYWPEAHGVEMLASGDFRRQAGYLCLEQALGADAGVGIFFLAALGPILERLGNRGYRLANLEAGIIGGRCYLGAYAQGFGASGLTYYDGDVVRFFSPHARGKDALFVTVLGRSVKGVPGIEVPLQIAKP
ncbi:MAG: SagB/ThcOx family dehydrogenase [Candidatus Rokubacteria bacterium]|nr:SagB/ThcOx family dehydrogenase [Candidatus Rokubacteria bacterium]